MASVFKSCLIAASIAAVAGLAVAAEGDKPGAPPGKTQMCVQTSRIDQSPAVDAKTIVLRMRDGTYKRVDLLNNCSGLVMGHGFAYETSINELCTSTPLHVMGPGGQTCMIDKIVDIDKAEAKALMSKEHEFQKAPGKKD